MMAGLDDIDKFILERMTEDARTSFRGIARDLGVSPDTVIGRYRRMEERGLIRGSTTVFDPARLGYQGMVAFHIDMDPSSPDGVSREVLENLIKLPNIIVATRTVGDHDLLALGVIFGVGHLVELSGEIGGIPGVKDLQVSIWETGREISPKYFIL
ncbi:MAG: AsnC family transcriptional regulator [Candidatus Bathyarchaeia archaeon]